MSEERKPSPTDFDAEDKAARRAPCHYCGKVIGDSEWVSFAVEGVLKYGHENACP